MNNKSIIYTALTLLIAGCSYLHPAKESDFHTNYEAEAVYILQQDVALVDTGRIWTSINRPRYWASKQELYDKRNAMLPKGSRIRFKKINYKYNVEMGRVSSPRGILLDPPFEGEPVSMRVISKRAEHATNRDFDTGKYINPLFLKKEKICE